jgi:hypothetical protein
MALPVLLNRKVVLLALSDTRSTRSKGTFILFGSSSFAQRCEHLFLKISNDANGGTLWVLDYGKASHFWDIPRL